MTSEQTNNMRLHHIIDAADHIANFLNNVSIEDFNADYEKQSAVIRQFEIIGEAAGKLSPEFIERHENIDWSKAIGMRHKMIHDYFEVEVDIIWDTAINDVPKLKTSVEKILS